MWFYCRQKKKHTNCNLILSTEHAKQRNCQCIREWQALIFHSTFKKEFTIFEFLSEGVNIGTSFGKHASRCAKWRCGDNKQSTMGWQEHPENCAIAIAAKRAAVSRARVTYHFCPRCALHSWTGLLFLCCFWMFKKPLACATGGCPFDRWIVQICCLVLPCKCH